MAKGIYQSQPVDAKMKHFVGGWPNLASFPRKPHNTTFRLTQKMTNDRGFEPKPAPIFFKRPPSERFLLLVLDLEMHARLHLVAPNPRALGCRSNPMLCPDSPTERRQFPAFGLNCERSAPRGSFGRRLRHLWPILRRAHAFAPHVQNRCLHPEWASAFLHIGT